MGQENRQDRNNEVQVNPASHKKIAKKKMNKLPVMYTNADSLKNKFTEFQVRIQDRKPKIIGITEVKPKNSTNPLIEAEFNLDDIGDYDVTPLNIGNDVGRGMLLYTTKDLDAKEVTMSTQFSENIFLEIKLTSEDSLLVGLIYRSDSGTDENNTNLRTLISEAISKGYSHVLIMGDFNYPSIDWNTWRSRGESTTSEEYLLIENLQDNFLFQHVDKPTRWRGTDNPNLLDLILTNEETMVDEISYQSPLGKSDHCVLFFDFVCYVEVETRYKVKKYYQKADYKLINQELCSVNWEEELSQTNNVNAMWNIFQSKIASIEEKYVPKKTITISAKTRSKIPIDASTFEKIRRKNALSRRYIATKDPDVRKEYNRIRNQVKREMRKLRKKFELNLAKEAKKNPKAIWRYINGKSKTRKGIGDLHIDPSDETSTVTDSDVEKAHILARFFSSVFTKEPDGMIPSLPPRNIEHSMEILKVTKEAIEDLLKNLKINKSPGPDNLSPYFLKHTASSISTPLQIIFNLSLEKSEVPLDWKRARISAIFKNKGSRKQAGNYRPVSLTSIICKVLESLIRDFVMTYMRENNLFTSQQYGFLSGRSISLQLLEVLDRWTEALDDKYSVDTIYMDFQKAFDVVPHRRLISKLSSYRFSHQMSAWIENFLTGRKQQVVVNNSKSNWNDVTSGIPQGSVLGPLLFVIFINDLPESVVSDVFLFADDTKIFRVIKSEEDQETLQNDLDKLNEWSEKWLLKFHPAKCKHMHIGRQMTNQPVYSLSSTNLESTKKEKDIGVFFDENLDFDSHIAEKSKKATQMFALLRRTFHFLNEETFLPLYKTLVRVHLDFASSVWCPYKIKHIEQLESVQRRITKQLPGMGNLSYPERLLKLKLPTLSYRRLRGDVIEVYKITNKQYDASCTSCLKLWRDSTNTESSLRGHSKKLFQQRARLSVRENSFGLRVVSVWNKLPEEVVSAKDVNEFKNKFDTFMASQDILYKNYRADVDI